MRRYANIVIPDVARLVSRLGNSGLGGFISDDIPRKGLGLFHSQALPSDLREAPVPSGETVWKISGGCGAVEKPPLIAPGLDIRRVSMI